nr:hypothetical protein [Deltaproteobacteria bacterium]
AMPRPTPALDALGLTGPEGQSRGPLYPDASPIAIGCDLDLEVLAAARDNAKAAGVTADVTWQRADVATLRPEVIAEIARERGRPEGKGLLLSNPPYGERLNESDLRELYGALALTVRKFKGWRAAFIVGNPLLEQVFFGIIGPPRIKKPLANANLRAYFYLFDVP